MKPFSPEIEYSRTTVRAWERLRLFYNLILVIPGGAILGRTFHLQSEFKLAAGTVLNQHAFPLAHPVELIALSFVFGFVANVCFCLGPYSEFVVTAIGYPLTGQRSRYFVFGLGVMLSLGVMALPWLYVEYFFVSSLIPAPAP